MTDGGIDDPVTEAILGTSTYERVRYTRYSLFTQPIPQRLAWMSGLLFLLALVLPLMAAFPSAVRATLPGGPVFGSPKVILLGFVGGVVVLGGGLALTGVGVARIRLEPEMTEHQAETLLSLEEVASLLAIGTGGLAIGLTMAYTLLGHGGSEAVQAYVETVGLSPFAPSGVEVVSVSGVSTFAFVGSVVLLVASQYLRAEHLLTLGSETDAAESSPQP